MENIELDQYRKDANVSSHGVEDNSDSDVQQIPGKNYDPSSDKRDMRRLGKTQELKRRFRFFSIVGYVVVLGLTWEFSLVLGAFSISNGGTAGAIWLTFVVCCGMAMVMLSLAEMASMAPTSGGQYHWVSEFAPRNMQKQLSFAVGWLTALGWQCAMPTVAYTGAQQVLAFIAVCDRDYVIQGWHGALLTMAFVLAAIFFNTSAIGKLPILEGLAVVFHTFGFFAFIIIIWVMGPRADAHTTFTTFADDNGWGSIGAATLIAIVAPTTTYLGADSAVHLAEELKDASHILPRAMVSAATINYVTGFVATITLMSNLGDIEEVLADPSGQPWVAVVYRATGSRAATLVLIVVMIVMYFFCAVNQVTCSSRQVWAFARDRGLPFHTFLSKVRPNSGVPANAVYVTLAFTCMLALIIIGSTAAFNIILSVSATGLFTSYLVCVLCVLTKRLRGEVFPATKFSLGKAGLPINAMAVCFLIVAYFFLFFPAVPNPAPSDMNWAILIYGVAVIFAIGYYFVKARHEYEGPVHYVRWQAQHEATETIQPQAREGQHNAFPRHLAVLATASFVFSAPLDTTAPFFNSTSNTNSLGFFGFGDDIYSWTVNFFSRPNCENTCVDTLYCPSALARATGDLPGSDQWSSVEGKWCWDVPEQLGKGGGSIGLSLSKHAVKKGRYVGTAMNCTVRHELGMFGEKRRLIAGKSKNAEKGMCNYGGGLADDIQAVVFELAE